MSISKKYKILVVDDSAVDRRMLALALKAEGDIEVVAEAADAFEARDLIAKHNPDLITLDLDMPRLDGLTFLKILMKKRPTPVIILSSFSKANSPNYLKAFELGAEDVLSKPGGSLSLAQVGPFIGARIRGVLSGRKKLSQLASSSSRRADPALPLSVSHVPFKWNSNQICLIGASTGGTVALKRLLMALPRKMPGICIVQHMPDFISPVFAEGLNEECTLRVKLAEDGDWVEPGLVLIAPGNHHMVLKRESGRYRVALNQADKVHYQRPSVDVLFRSAVPFAGKNFVAALLTGMGRDGAEGMLELKKAGVHTIGQDKATSAVYGMPKAAFDIGATNEVLPLDAIPEAILHGIDRGSGLGSVKV